MYSDENAKTQKYIEWEKWIFEKNTRIPWKRPKSSKPNPNIIRGGVTPNPSTSSCREIITVDKPRKEKKKREQNAICPSEH